MVNRLFIIFIAIAFVGCNIDKVKENDLSVMKLQGRVKSVKEFDRMIRSMGGGVTNDKDELRYVYFFSEDGMLTEVHKHYFNKEEIWINKFIYDGNGRLIEKLMELEGHLGNYYRLLFTYNESGYLTKETLYWLESEKGELQVEYMYDENGNMIEKIQYDEYYYLDNDTSRKQVYKYDYDNLGNVIREYTYLSDKIFVDSIKYDGSLKIMNENEYGKTTYKYDNFGNEIEENSEYYQGGGIKKTTSYEFDNNNNWITKTTYSGGILNDFVSTRVIEYYK